MRSRCAGQLPRRWSVPAAAKDRVRTPIRIPDIPGFVTLACDFHAHTVFSDGSVWPDVRVEEAWRDGLDAIAITDHIEYQPHKDDLPVKHNRSYEIAKSHGDALGVIVIRGSEITREMPPGHFNAIFLSDCSKLETKEWRDAIQAAHEQGAFIFWNHPGWTGQQPDGIARWYDEHTELLEKGLLNGIELVNERSYYPEAHRWALEKKLTMVGTSDIHPPISMEYEPHLGDRRPVTLVFARERTAEAIREALFARRTAVWWQDKLAGAEEFLKPIFERSVKIENPRVRIAGKGRVLLWVRNDSDVPCELEAAGSVEGLSVSSRARLPAGKTALLSLTGLGNQEPGTRTVGLPFRVKNFLVAPEEGLQATLEVEVTFAK